MNTFRQTSWLVFLLGSLLLISPVHAQDVKIGFVNTDRIFREANSAKAAQTKLEQEFSKREKELIELGNSVKSLSEKLEREAPTLSERRNEELQQVLERANRVVKQVAEAEKYDAIFQEAVYINPKHDVTDKVIKALNATSGSK